MRSPDGNSRLAPTPTRRTTGSGQPPATLRADVLSIWRPSLCAGIRRLHDGGIRVCRAYRPACAANARKAPRTLRSSAGMSSSTSSGEQPRQAAPADPDSGPIIDFDPTLRLGDLFASAAIRHPEEVALRFEGHDLDYRTLAAQVGRVSRALASHGIGPGHRVGVCAQRGHGMFQSLLGVLVSGAAFVPLDPAMPGERMREVCEDADLSAVIGPEADLSLAATSLPRATPRLAVEGLAGAEAPGDEPLQVAGSADDPAYVIFTSGSTGRPKGAVNAHRGVVNRLLWGQLDWPIGPGDRVIQKTPFTFDVSVWEYLWPLTTGAMLVVARPGGHRDPAYIASLVRNEGITLAHFVPSMLRLFLHEPSAAQCRSLRRVMCSGEALPADSVRRFHECLPGVRLSNLYGPTEAAIEVTRWECDPAHERNPVPIGAPVANTRIYVLDPEGRRVAPGQEGEIVIAGVQVGQGYFGRPELSEAVFKDDPFHPGQRMYHTGDLGRWTPDGVVECLGRIDHQVKIRGNRIELGEIEARLRRHPGLRDCVASALPDPLGETRLVVHLVPSGAAAPSLHDVHDFLRDQLPDYMLPDAVVAMDALPLLSSGKTDRRALPSPAFSTPQARNGSSTDDSAQSLSIGGLWRELLGQPDLPDSANLFDAGARSVTVLAFLSRMRESGVATVTVGDIYDRPTIAALEKLHRGRDTGPVQARKATGGAIAIVGMAVRAPGANDLASFWDMLCEGREGIRRFAPGELDPEVPETLRTRSDFVPAKGIIEDADRFDAALFGVPPREATLTDPQQRILVEMALHALEHAGIDPERCPDIGVFVGTANNTYVAHLRQHAAQLVAQSGEFATMVGNDKDFVATRIAHRLNLKGPAISVHTACSTGLVTVAQAVQALRSGQCEAALAGGATVIVPQRTGHLHIEGGMESADGHCRPFDAGASGTVFSSGAALVVLRRLDDALAAGDTVYAVIEGVGVNNDGGHKASFTAPSVEGQCDAIRRALRDADADPADIGYVEAHGTGTPLGDPIEVSGLARAWGSRDPSAERCMLGSVKANVGHTIAAAGVLGLIRCALSLHHEKIPGTPHFDAPNPHIDFSTTAFTVQREARPWPRRPRRAWRRSAPSASAEPMPTWCLANPRPGRCRRRQAATCPCRSGCRSPAPTATRCCATPTLWPPIWRTTRPSRCRMSPPRWAAGPRGRSGRWPPPATARKP
ncbi:amino acid adenylation domain-containing protein [Alkalisalibacterium limincola]|uniref:Amino acid adenylation domain-containing protein n=1 Tax=Alkalisalibacterium limincola TaxID=2699169 RepID=A0A5C8KWI7_9GAMM|nr:amino acid adenylation domain-containing protein [Alkalisalibacterium limincola]